MRRRTPAVLAAVAVSAAVALFASSPADADPSIAAVAPADYEVLDVRSPAQRNAIARTGVAINDIEHGIAHVTATNAEVRALRRAGFTVQAELTTLAFPPADVERGLKYLAYEGPAAPVPTALDLMRQELAQKIT